LTVDIRLAHGDCVVLLDYIADHVHDLVSADTDAPPQVADSVVDAGLPGVTHALKSVASQRAE